MKPTTEKHSTKCFIIMPITTPESWVEKYLGDEDQFNHVLDYLLIPAIEKAGFEPISPITKGAELIQGEIIKNIESADFVLCDMSILNPNVFFELGIRTSLNKPVCIIRDDLTENVPFDVKMINNHEYSSALYAWELDAQIEALATHIKDSFAKCKGSNSLWKYFGLSSSAQPFKEEGADAKIDFLIRQVEVLREKLNPSDFSSKKIYSAGISSDDKLRRSYSELIVSFEDLVSQCLNELKITKKAQTLQSDNCDFLVINPKNGKNIPIEVKFYLKRVVANELPSQLIKKMKNCMNQVGSDESIVIISSKVTPEALELFKALAGKDKIHIVTGNTKEELKSQLTNIFT
ncbi:MAG: restriction endonuclease [Candidatus Methanoperedens sp.]|nr:restriction endonuclease [Candidatus Methanoperedens sp.]